MNDNELYIPSDDELLNLDTMNGTDLTEVLNSLDIITGTLFELKWILQSAFVMYIIFTAWRLVRK